MGSITAGKVSAIRQIIRMIRRKDRLIRVGHRRIMSIFRHIGETIVPFRLGQKMKENSSLFSMVIRLRYR